MCLYSYKLYPSNTKIYSRLYSDKMLTNYKCGHCPDCLESLRKEWYFRSIHEFDDTIRSPQGGYMLFDCLTYRPSDVPRISRFFSVPKNLDFMCFDHRDTTLFFKQLRIDLDRAGYAVAGNLKFFYATEYGTDPSGTHRPHIHILFFVRNNFIDPLDLSRFVSDAWKHGRTDGVPYKSKYYVQSRCVISGDPGSSARVCSYVSKYVVKSLSYDNQLEKRVNSLMRYFFEDIKERPDQYLDPLFGIDSECISLLTKPRRTCYGDIITDDGYFEFCRSPRGRRIRASIKRVLDMYHRQSQFYGYSAIRGVDPESLIEDNTLKVRDAEKVVMRIALPTYYKRHLFQEKVVVNGMQCWQLTSIGKRYKIHRDIAIRDRVKQRLKDDCCNAGVDFDVDQLSRYLLDKRGRLIAPYHNELTIIEKSRMPFQLFSYVTPSDVQHYKMRLVTDNWSGCSQTGYSPIVGQSFDDFCSKNVFIDQYYEKQLNDLDLGLSVSHAARNYSYSLRQRLKELYKSLQI